MRLTFYSSPLPHYIDYLAPLWLALPEELRGEFFTRDIGAIRAREYGIEPNITRIRRSGHELFVVAGQHDGMRVAPAPAILINHGAGQRYIDAYGQSDHPSYSGGIGRDNIVLHLCPSKEDAELNSVFAESVAVGPYKLDPWLNGSRSPKRDGGIYISFHHDANLGIPEGQSAFPHYAVAIANLPEWVKDHIVGHAHPRAQHLESFWNRIGVPFEPDFAKVLDRASVFVADNTSALFEAAAVGIPVVVLDSPEYRPEVSHGLRFWEAADVGIRICDPKFLESAINTALDAPLTVRLRRDRIIRSVYSGLTDGHATERAVEALVRFCERRQADADST